MFIIGAGGHGKSVAEVAITAGFKIIGFIAPNHASQEFLGVRIFPELPKDISQRPESIGIAIGTNYIREQVWMNLSQVIPLNRFPVIIHPSAVVAQSAILGPGSTIHQNSVVGPFSNIGKFCTINTSSSVDHDSTIEDFASIGPGVHMGGGVHVGQRSHIAIGATAIHNIQVGKDSIVGAGSCVIQSVPDCTVSMGVPARVVRNRLPGDSYL